jgi:hypothetical protein
MDLRPGGPVPGNPEKPVVVIVPAGEWVFTPEQIERLRIGDGAKG